MTPIILFIANISGLKNLITVIRSRMEVVYVILSGITCRFSAENNRDGVTIGYAGGVHHNISSFMKSIIDSYNSQFSRVIFMTASQQLRG